MPDEITSDKYKFLNKLKLQRIVTPAPNRGYAETWPADEPGSPEFPRPTELPIGSHGIQVFKPEAFSEDDIAGEGLHIDPVAAKYRSQFSQTLSSDQIAELKRQPDYMDSKKAGMSEEASLQNAVDAAIRGYAVGQWPQEAVKQFFNQGQMQILDGLKSYMQSGEEVLPDEAGYEIGYGKRR